MGLKLRRTAGESVTLTVPPSGESQTITVKVEDIDRFRVALYFEAPVSVRIMRSELEGRGPSGVAYDPELGKDYA